MLLYCGGQVSSEFRSIFLCCCIVKDRSRLSLDLSFYVAVLWMTGLVWVSPTGTGTQVDSSQPSGPRVQCSGSSAQHTTTTTIWRGTGWTGMRCALPFGQGQGWHHEFEGGGSMHWKVEGQYSKNTKLLKRWGGCMTPKLIWWYRPWIGKGKGGWGMTLCT